MARVNVRNAREVKTVTYVGEPAPITSGCVSQVSWGNPDTMRALRVLFNCKPDEQIVAVEISDIGIKAKFERG